MKHRKKNKGMEERHNKEKRKTKCFMQVQSKSNEQRSNITLSTAKLQRFSATNITRTTCYVHRSQHVCNVSDGAHTADIVLAAGSNCSALNNAHA
jgi:formate dehydrogenase assembly factor FdhD